MTMRKRSRSCFPAACRPKSSTRSRRSSRPSSSVTQIRVLEVRLRGHGRRRLLADVKFSLRHVQDFSRVAIVINPDMHHLWSNLVAPFMRCDVEHFSPGETEAARDRLMWPEGAVD